MVSRHFEALSTRQIARAKLLTRRYPASEEVFDFFMELVSFQVEIFEEIRDRGSLSSLLTPLVQLMGKIAPRPLRSRAAALDESNLRRALDDYWNQVDTFSPESLFARVLLQPYAVKMGAEGSRTAPNLCPRCGHRPQLSVLRTEGHGRALTLLCSLCLQEWAFPSRVCPACGEDDEKKLPHQAASQFEHIHVVMCDSCRVYLHSIDVSQEVAAVPEVDELAALPLDVWAQEQGFTKLQPNIAGI